MRCLRCALDYGPDEQFCNRCGRALSRPPGSKDDAPFSPVQETAFLYTTTSPPGQGKAGSASTPSSDGFSAPSSNAPQAALPPSSGRAALPPAPATVPIGTSFQRAGEMAALPPSISRDLDDGMDDAARSPAERLALPGSLYIPPPSMPDAPAWDVDSDKVASGDQSGLDDDDRPKVRPAAIGIDADIWRNPLRRTQRSSRKTGLRFPRALLLAPLAVIILLILVVGIQRHGSYSAHLKDAQALAAAHKFDAAIAKYNQAVNEWPLNTDAKNDLASVQADIQATATTLQAEVQATATAVTFRQGMYQAYLSERTGAAQVNDSNAAATATSVVQDTQATATSVAQDAQATKTAAAVITQHATATVVARAVATVAVAQARAAATTQASFPVGDSGVTGVVSHVLPSIVRVVANLGGGNASEGTGIVIANDASGSYIVTNNHVVKGTSSVSIYPDNSSPLAIDNAATDANNDLAVLHVDVRLPVAEWNTDPTFELGQSVIAIGYAEGLAGRPTITTGILSAIDRDDGAGHLFDQHSAPINPGNSGGPLLDLHGRVLGINTLSLVDTQGLFFAIPAQRAIPVVATLERRMTPGQ